MSATATSFHPRGLGSPAKKAALFWVFGHSWGLPGRPIQDLIERADSQLQECLLAEQWPISPNHIHASSRPNTLASPRHLTGLFVGTPSEPCPLQATTASGHLSGHLMSDCEQKLCATSHFPSLPNNGNTAPSPCELQFLFIVMWGSPWSW